MRTCGFKDEDGNRCGKPSRHKTAHLCREHHILYMKNYFRKHPKKKVSSPKKDVYEIAQIARLKDVMADKVPCDVALELYTVMESGDFKQWPDDKKLIIPKVIDGLEDLSQVPNCIKMLDSLTHPMKPRNRKTVDMSIDRLKEIA